MTVHRIWDFRGDQAGIVWFRKQADGSVQVLRRLVDAGFPLIAYAQAAHSAGIDPGSIDYVRSDAHNRNFNGLSTFEALRIHGLNPEVLPDALWRTPTPFAAQAAA